MKVTVPLPDCTTWNALQEQVRQHGGVMLSWPPGSLPKPFSQVEVVFVTAEDKVIVEVAGQVVQVGGDRSVAMTLSSEVAEKLTNTEYPQPRSLPAGPEPLWLQYKSMSKAEKISLARTGKVDARRLVLQDRDHSLHGHLADNPGLQAAEVASMLRTQSNVDSGFLSRLQRRSDLMSNAAVIEALVSHAKTPVPVAVNLIKKLPLDVVRRIARKGNLKAPIVRAARKRVLR